ncbi:LSU ribosomal protein L9p [hydrothermal vent metagenome]|uniref:LSU ribosomal protein L9p n=1 Tax=hydrothermal vent metagenome TaxID=652676 RepID=A0A3B0U2U6_9ZZZZ
MKVILLERVGRLGTIGDEVNVKSGFGRNYLLPQGKAIRANEANRARFEAEREVIEKRNEDRRNEAAGIADGLNGANVVMIRQASEAGTLYGSVSSRDISDGLSDIGFSVVRSAIDLPLPIKTVGIHEVSLKLHAEVEVVVNVNVARSEAEAQRQEAGEDMTVASFDDDIAEEVETEDATSEDETLEDGAEGEDATSDEDASDEEASKEEE